MRFTKTGRVRFIGHLDLVRVWERAVRRANLPLEFTAGFSPRPRMHFGLALPTCYASTAEYLDLDLDGEVDPAAAAAALSAVLPQGIDVIAVAAVVGDSVSLQAAVGASDYVVVTNEDPDSLAERIDVLLAAESLDFEVARKGRTQVVDLRPGIIDLSVVVGTDADVAVSGRSLVRMRLAAVPRSYRPTEVCAVMEPPVAPTLVHRSAQLVGGPIDFSEPLPVGHPAAGRAPKTEPIEERSGDGPLREEVPSESPAAAVAPRLFAG